jgi:hypothetical protein
VFWDASARGIPTRGSIFDRISEMKKIGGVFFDLCLSPFATFALKNNSALDRSLRPPRLIETCFYTKVAKIAKRVI